MALKKCILCGKEFKQRVVVDGRLRDLTNRKYCFDCSPFGSGNTRKLTKEYLMMNTEERVANKKKKDHIKSKKWQDRIRKERKQKLVDILGGKCQKCGYNKCIQCLTFHHKDPSTKKFSISFYGFGRRWTDLVEEAKKCDLLCMNCHGETHLMKV